jgi:hypothetical protein
MGEGSSDTWENNVLNRTTEIARVKGSHTFGLFKLQHAWSVQLREQGKANQIPMEKSATAQNIGSCQASTGRC